jgi:nucleotide-binding universal stress UspA family protein
VVDRPFEQVLVPLDGSRAAERGLVPALELVRQTGVPLRLLSRALPGQIEELGGYLAELADRYAAVTDVETQLVDVESIPDAITTGIEPGTLVCMSSHGHGRSEALVGSVTEAVLRALGQPVLVVGPRVPEDTTLGDGQVVACLDGSDLSERTLDSARAWSAALGLPLWLAQVAPPGIAVEQRTHGDVIEGGYLAALAHQTGGVEGWDILHDKDAARGLAKYAASEQVAMLVLATHGRTGWDRVRLGSVTAATVHRATVPVLVVPAVAQPTPAGR